MRGGCVMHMKNMASVKGKSRRAASWRNPGSSSRTIDAGDPRPFGAGTQDDALHLRDRQYRRLRRGRLGWYRLLHLGRTARLRQTSSVCAVRTRWREESARDRPDGGTSLPACQPRLRHQRDHPPRSRCRLAAPPMTGRSFWWPSTISPPPRPSRRTVANEGRHPHQSWPPCSRRPSARPISSASRRMWRRARTVVILLVRRRISLRGAQDLHDPATGCAGRINLQLRRQRLAPRTHPRALAEYTWNHTTAARAEGRIRRSPICRSATGIPTTWNWSRRCAKTFGAEGPAASRGDARERARVMFRGPADRWPSRRPNGWMRSWRSTRRWAA